MVYCDFELISRTKSFTEFFYLTNDLAIDNLSIRTRERKL